MYVEWYIAFQVLLPAQRVHGELAVFPDGAAPQDFAGRLPPAEERLQPQTQPEPRKCKRHRRRRQLGRRRRGRRPQAARHAPRLRGQDHGHGKDVEAEEERRKMARVHNITLPFARL